MTGERGRKGMSREYAKGRMREWHASRGKSRNLMGQASVGCELWLTLAGTLGRQCLSEPASNALSYWCKKQAPFSDAAVVGTQYHPLFACGWWRLGGRCNDNTHSAHILLFSTQVWCGHFWGSEQCYVTLCTIISGTHFKCDLNYIWNWLID